jgi:hypothetical protein
MAIDEYVARPAIHACVLDCVAVVVAMAIKEAKQVLLKIVPFSPNHCRNWCGHIISAGCLKI